MLYGKETCEQAHRPAEPVLRELMGDYITRSRASLSPAERLCREEAVKYAMASVGLEGFKISVPEQKHAQRFINGNIELPDFLQACQPDAPQAP